MVAVADRIIKSYSFGWKSLRRNTAHLFSYHESSQVFVSSAPLKHAVQSKSASLNNCEVRKPNQTRNALCCLVQNRDHCLGKWITAVLQCCCSAYNRIYVTSSLEKIWLSKCLCQSRYVSFQLKLIFTQKNSIGNSSEMDSSQLQSPEKKGFLQSTKNSLIIELHSSTH